MKTHALKALTNRRAVVKAITVDSSVQGQDPLGFLFERHRQNPFVRFLRAAFFYDDDERERFTRDRVPGERSCHGSLRGSLKF